MAIGGDLHSDAEAVLLDRGSAQKDVWGVNLYPKKTGGEWIQFDSMINIRPSQGNNSREVEDLKIRKAIRGVVETLIRS